MTKYVTFDQLNEALARQTILIVDLIDERMDKKIDAKLDAQTRELTEVLNDMMFHIDNRFNDLENAVYGSNSKKPWE